MNIKNIKIKSLGLVLVASAVFGLSGCSKFLDVNTNPNNPDKADPSLLLPTVEASISQVVGNSLQVYGSIWAQYWTQSPSSSQYKTVDQYQVSNANTNTAWVALYRNALNNAQMIIDSKEAKNEYYKGIAYLLKAYTFQVATDAFGDVPVAEALTGAEHRSPKYDSQEVVYDSVFNFVDKGLALLKIPNANAVGTQDMLFGGDLTQWTAFGNTLKLKAYLRLSEKNATKAAAGVKALYDSKATFLSKGVSITYTSTGGNENPLYNEMIGLGRTQNIVASATVAKAFKRNNDPRLYAFFSKLPKQDTIAYIPQGSFEINSDKLVSPPSALVAGNANDSQSALAPVWLFSSAESKFLQAEAIVRGWASGDATALFNQGVKESFKAAKLTDAESNVYLANAVDAKDFSDKSAAAKLESIITQKYYAMCGSQGFEAWSEWRRTGYPTFFEVSVASRLGAGRWPLRLPYPQNEVTSNGNFPGIKFLYEPVWWDVK